MTRVFFGVFVCLLLTGLLAVMCPAQEEEVAIGNTFGVGARSMGMGGASLGLADDFTALYWNPAGLAQIQKFELFTSVSHNTASIDSSFTNDETIGTSRSRLRPNSIGIVYPIATQQGGFAVAFGYNRVQNFDFQTKIQGIGPNSGDVFSGLVVNETNRNTGGIGIWSFGGSVYITKNLLIGGSIDYWNGDSLNELDVTATDTLNIREDLSRFSYDDEIDREYSGISGRVGVLAHFVDAISLGVTLVAPTELTVDEFWRQYEITYSDDNNAGESKVDDGGLGFDIERPIEIGTGVAVKLLNKQLILAGDIQITDWRQTRYDPSPAENIPDDFFEEFYATTLQTRLGIEYQIPVIASYVRAGYFRDTIPFTDAEIENERDFLTFGVGKIFEESIKFDLAYMWGNWQQSRSNLTTKRNSHRVFVSGAYRF